jgi:PAS domain S-box-containing protein
LHPVLTKNEKPTAVPRLRWRAEQLAQQQAAQSPEDLTRLSRAGMLKLVHELRVHQIELKMQNDELCRAQAEINAIRERYVDLYNLAPIGYFIVSHEGRIVDTNLAGVTLLGVPRAALVRQPIARFILKEDQDVYYHHRRQLLATGRAHTCELRMVRREGTPCWVRLTAILSTPSTASGNGMGEKPISRVVLSDISEQKQMEADRATRNVRYDRGNKRSGVGRKAGKDWR